MAGCCAGSKVGLRSNRECGSWGSTDKVILWGHWEILVQGRSGSLGGHWVGVVLESCSGIFLLGGGWGSRACLCAGSANQLLCLCGVISYNLLGGGCSAGSLLRCKLLHLLSLLVGKVGSLLQLLIDELLVGLVDEWCEEDNGGSNQSQPPEWNDLDEEVGDEGCNKCL